MNSEHHHNDQPAQPPPATATCDLCGRPFPKDELHEWRGQLLCDACRQEEEGCGCADDPD